MFGLAQSFRLNPYQTATREHFQEGGSILGVLAVAAAIAAVVLVAYLLTRQQRKASQVDRLDDPRRLFEDLQKRLNLPPTQRYLLDAVAEHLHLTQPTVLLLSPALFDRYVDQWRTRRQADVRAKQEVSTEDVAATRAVLFGG